MSRISKIASMAYIPVILLLLNHPSSAQRLSSGLLFGASGGPGFQAQFRAQEFARGFPFILRLGFGYASRDAGNPADARKIFINDATNGIPEKRGWMWDFRLDFLFRVHWFGWQNFYFGGGPRYARFTGNYKFVGGNEDFDVRSKPWGFGLAAEKYYAVNHRIDLVVAAGVDHYSKATLQGHDTAYSPTGEAVNGRKDYTYEDADRAVNQPEVVPRVLIGLSYRFNE